MPKSERQKMTHTDYQIELLLKMGAEETEVGRRQLSSLKERKSLMAELGIVNVATIVPKFPPSKKGKESIIGGKCW